MYADKGVAVIIPAAGAGSRMGTVQRKQFLNLRGKEVLEWTLCHLLEDESIDAIWIAAPGSELASISKKIKQWQKKDEFKIPIYLTEGGETRQESVFKALMNIPERFKYVAVHDGVRPFPPKGWIGSNLKLLSEVAGVSAAIPAVDTLMRVDASAQVLETLVRSEVWAIQTPQLFEREVLMKAHFRAIEDQFTGTDDAGLVERIDGKIQLKMGSLYNIKITTPLDLVIGEAILTGAYPL